MEKLSLLRTVDLFTQLSTEELRVLAEHAEFLEFRDGDEVFATGKTDRELFVIESGEVRIVKEDRNGKAIDLARFVAGEGFGEQDFMNDNPRTASAVSEGDTRLLVFPARGTSVDTIMLEHPRIFARVLHQLIATVADRIRSTNKLVGENSGWVRELRQQVFGDKLTGLFSRDFLEDEVPGMLGNWSGHTGLLMIKPDNFKLINDTYGHDVGDQALRILANRLKALLGEDDIAIRFRGNENVAVLPERTDEEIAEAAKLIKDGMKSADLSPVIGDDEVPLTFSVGIAVFPDESRDCEELATLAHERVFAARDAGGDQIVTAQMAESP
jgi:diguanylate cyclase (GGDEF)-like protein